MRNFLAEKFAGAETFRVAEEFGSAGKMRSVPKLRAANKLRRAEKFRGANTIRLELEIWVAQTAIRSGLCEPEKSRIVGRHKESGGQVENEAALFIKLLRSV